MQTIYPKGRWRATAGGKKDKPGRRGWRKSGKVFLRLGVLKRGSPRRDRSGGN